MMILNARQLARTPLRKKALAILESGYRAIETKPLLEKLIRRHGSRIILGDKQHDLSKFQKVYFIGVGKVAFHASQVIAHRLGNRLAEGIVLDLQGRSFARVRVSRTTHPLPSAANVTASKKIIGLLRRVASQDLVITVISGGASTMLCAPHARGSWQQERDLIKLLFERGATIHEINTIRKHNSQLRGGAMAALCSGTMVNLIFSDVCGNDLSTIGSGPTVYDRTTVVQARAVLNKYHVEFGRLHETPKNKRIFRNIENNLLISNRIALEAMAIEARRQGFGSRIFSDAAQGEARNLGKRLAKECRPGEALIVGGETTVTVRGSGKGGRNQELVLGALGSLANNQVIASVGSDGYDNSHCAGAIADVSTRARAEALNLDIQKFLDENNSFPLFGKLTDRILARRSAVNIADLMLVCRTNS
ncbi:DUF4147 domain-containing protein [Candidatus Uhrbacteria bacterium]|nr:DUF4147 domain-containing protein [Candidatus Uhrbacteria bacterium]